MTFLITLMVTLVCVVVLRTPLRRAPWLFYLLAVAACVLFLARDILALPGVLERPLVQLMQKAQVAESLFVIVMYIGVFASRSKPRAYLQPVRAPLSIIAAILVLTHVAAYLSSFGLRLLMGGTPASVFTQASVVVALVLLALLLILGLTSFEVLKRRMKTRHWVRLQRLAYVFYALTYAHILLFLMPPALAGSAVAQASVLGYSLIFLLYFVLRVLRWRKDRRQA